MKKRLFAWLMVVVMLVSALPLTAFAKGGGGGVNPPSDSYYNPNNKFGYDSMNQNGTVVGASVSVGSTALTEGVAGSTTGAAYSSGITIAFQPGYYLSAYKVVCGDKYGCQTAASGNAVSESDVMSGATQSSITLNLEKKAFGHSSQEDPYWILLNVLQDTTKYTVSYTWGDLAGKIETAVPASEEHLVNDVVTVKAPSQEALDEAKALGYTFTGWKSNVSGTTYQPNGKFGMPQNNVVLVAQWEKIPTVDVTVTKVWNDNNNANNNRPASITVTLKKDGEAAGSVTLPKDGKWEYTWTGLPTGFTYTVEEAAVTGYNSVVTGDAANGFVITNTEATTSITVKKEWKDADNQDGKRPAEITVSLYKGEGNNKTKVNDYVLTAKDGWTLNIGNLPKYENGKEIVYSVDEAEVADGYTKSISGFTITNTHTPETTSVSVKKEWEDNDNQDGKRPAEITVSLYNGEGGNKTPVGNYTLTAKGEWKLTIPNLPKYENGKEIVYSISESAVNGYTSSVTGNAKDGFTVTNTHTPETTSVSVTKVWDDNDDQYKNRPESITVKLLADGNETGKTVTLNEGNNWTASFTGLAKYSAGQEISYTVEEIVPDGYASSVNGGTITNTTTIIESITATKKWEDSDNIEGFRPESIQLQLMANREAYGSPVEVKADDDGNWTYTWYKLPTHMNGQKVTYTVKEVDAPEAYTSVPGTADNGYVVTNSRDVEYYTSVSITKAWVDGDDQDRIRPESVTVTLYKDGGDSMIKVADYVLTAENGWTLDIGDLQKYEGGKEIVYTVDEAEVPEGYTTTSITGSAAEGFTVTNTHTPETVEVSGHKTWVDNDDAAQARPESITINLLADGEKVASKTITAEDEWKWSFEDLAKNKDGKEITYTITEEAVANYVPTVDGYNVTNTYNPGKTYISVEKKWDDNDDQDGKRPDSVYIQLFADGDKVGELVELNAKNQWTYTFTDLDKTSNGKLVEYTVKEKAVDGYKATYSVNGNAVTITNTHDPETKDLTISKLWYDNNDKNDLRPDSIEAQLYKNGKAYGDKVKLTAKNDWKYTFEDMPVYEDGKKIEWTVKEVKVPEYYNVGYNQNTLTIINTIQSDGSARTGDDFNIWLWVSLMGVSAACVATFLILNKKRKSV